MSELAALFVDPDIAGAQCARTSELVILLFRS